MAARNEYLELWPDNKGVAAAVDLCEGFTARDWKRVEAAIGDDIAFAVPGASPLAQTYEGVDAFVGLIRRLAEEGSLRFPKPDVYDILISPYHLVVLSPFLGERVDGRAFDSYLIFQFHGGEKLGSYGGLFPGDPVAFDAFWA